MVSEIKIQAPRLAKMNMIRKPRKPEKIMWTNSDIDQTYTKK